MNGYQYLIARNRLMQHLERELAALEPLPTSERAEKRRRIEAEFDIRLRELYAQVAEEYPGERRKKARPLSDPR
jgi:hypothetical protein